MMLRCVLLFVNYKVKMIRLSSATSINVMAFATAATFKPVIVLLNMNTIAVAARIKGKNIELFDCNGARVGYACTTGMAWDEHWVSAQVNGNILVGVSDRGTMGTWELRPDGSAVLIARR